MRPWTARIGHFFTYMRECGWHGIFRQRGQSFDVIGMPVPWQARDADNDNGGAP